jgi:putative addiction module component (TIGR02574 family)
MANTLERVREQAMELTEDERLALARDLVVSVPSDDAWKRAWAVEANRRFEELRTGAVPALTREEFFRDDD